jgi:hypothetical protein
MRGSHGKVVGRIYSDARFLVLAQLLDEHFHLRSGARRPQMQCDTERDVGVVQRQRRCRVCLGFDRSRLLVDREFQYQLDFNQRIGWRAG